MTDLCIISAARVGSLRNLMHYEKKKSTVVRFCRYGKLIMMYALDALIHVTMVALPPTYKPASYTRDGVYPFGLTWDLVNKYRLRGSSPNYCKRQARNLEQPLVLDDVWWCSL